MCIYIIIDIYIYTNLSYCLIFERFAVSTSIYSGIIPGPGSQMPDLGFPSGKVSCSRLLFCKAANGCGKLEGHGRIMIRNHRGKKRRFRRERRRVHSSFSNIICLVPIEISRHHKTPIIEFRGRQEIYVWYLEASSITWLTPQSDDLYGGHVFVAQPVGLQVRGRGYIYIIIYIWLNNIKYILHM